MKLHGETDKDINYVTTEQDRTYFRELIWKNAIELFEKRKGMSHNSILKSQRKFINSFNLNGYRNKYKTVELLNTYFKSSNKLLAEQVFYNTVFKKVKN